MRKELTHMTNAFRHLRMTALLGTTLAAVVGYAILTVLTPEILYPDIGFAQRSTPKIRFTADQTAEGVTAPRRHNVYFRCPQSTDTTPIFSESIQQSANVFVWGYEFSGNETVNSILGKRGNELWDGKYFISRSYVATDRTNAQYRQIGEMQGGKWYFITSTHALQIECGERIAAIPTALDRPSAPDIPQCEYGTEIEFESETFATHFPEDFYTHSTTYDIDEDGINEILFMDSMRNLVLYKGGRVLIPRIRAHRLRIFYALNPHLTEQYPGLRSAMHDMIADLLLQGASVDIRNVLVRNDLVPIQNLLAQATTPAIPFSAPRKVDLGPLVSLRKFTGVIDGETKQGHLYVNQYLGEPAIDLRTITIRVLTGERPEHPPVVPTPEDPNQDPKLLEDYTIERDGIRRRFLYIEPADINGDGREDIVAMVSAPAPDTVGSPRLPSIEFYWIDTRSERATLMFQAETVPAETPTSVGYFRLADMNLDGNIDMITSGIRLSPDLDDSGVEQSLYLENPGDTSGWDMQIVGVHGPHDSSFSIVEDRDRAPYIVMPLVEVPPRQHLPFETLLIRPEYSCRVAPTTEGDNEE